MLVTIVYVPTADRTGPDVDRMETVEDIEPDLARAMLADGSAREPSTDELATYRKARQVEEKTATQVPAASDASEATPSQGEPVDAAAETESETPAELETAAGVDASRAGRGRSRG